MKSYDDFIAKNKLLKDRGPVIDKYWLYMTDKDKKQFRQEMEDGIGFER